MNIGEKKCNNSVYVAGVITRQLEFSHEIFGEKFYSTEISIKRNSGTFDKIVTIISERLINYNNIDIGSLVGINGEFRSWNSPENHLKLFIFVNELEIFSEEEVYKNKIVLTGYICKKPVYRLTPKGKEVTDILIATNRKFNRSDYIPSIFWGRNAKYANTLKVGDMITCIGRIQSRYYSKCINDTWVQKVAYEVSCNLIEKVLNY